MTRAASSRLFSDAWVARRAAQGSQRAFATIFERYHQDLYRYCAAMLGNTEDAHDAVQNTMLKVLRALPGETRDLKLKSWLYRIAHNEAIDLIRARKGSEPIDVQPLVDRAEPADEVEARDRLRQLISDIAELPDRQRGALVMREMAGLSYEEIGAALQTSAAVARQTLYEARLGLRQMNKGREMSCQEVMRAISDEDGRVLRRRDIRAHLLRCESCQAFHSEISNRRGELAAIAPLPAAVSAGILQTLWGGSAGGASSMAGAAAGKTLIGSTAAIKSAGAVCAVTAVGVFAADDSGLIQLGHGGPPNPPVSAASRQAPEEGDRAATATQLGGAGRAALGQGRKLPAPRARRDIRQASAAEPGSPAPDTAPAPPAPPSAEHAPEPSGQHLGWSSSPSHGGSPGKPDRPAKGKKGPPATPPGQGKSHGQAKHAAAENAGGEGASQPHPPHPPQPESPGHSEAPGAGAVPPAGAEPGNQSAPDHPATE